MARVRSMAPAEADVALSSPRESSEDEEGEDDIFEINMLKNGKRFAGVFSHIFDKYDRDFDTDESGAEEIDLADMEQLEILDKRQAGSQLGFDLPSDDDESEPDPELAALLHQKIVTVKKEINWDKEEQEYLNRKRKRPRCSSDTELDSPPLTPPPPPQRARTVADCAPPKPPTKTCRVESTPAKPYHFESTPAKACRVESRVEETGPTGVTNEAGSPGPLLAAIPAIEMPPYLLGGLLPQPGSKVVPSLLPPPPVVAGIGAGCCDSALGLRGEQAIRHTVVQSRGSCCGCLYKYTTHTSCSVVAGSGCRSYPAAPCERCPLPPATPHHPAASSCLCSRCYAAAFCSCVKAPPDRCKMCVHAPVL